MVTSHWWRLQSTVCVWISLQCTELMMSSVIFIVMHVSDFTIVHLQEMQAPLYCPAQGQVEFCTLFPVGMVLESPYLLQSFHQSCLISPFSFCADVWTIYNLIKFSHIVNIVNIWKWKLHSYQIFYMEKTTVHMNIVLLPSYKDK